MMTTPKKKKKEKTGNDVDQSPAAKAKKVR
jgi:hypothetical protein